jgi:tripartite ATP-independent transporter DctP family solute receptor
MAIEGNTGERNAFMTWSSNLAVLAATFCFAATSAASAAKFEARLAHQNAPTHASHRGLINAAELIKQRTNGDVNITVYPSSQLGGARETIEGVQLGTIELANTPTAWLAGFNALVSVLDIPYILPTSRDDSRKLLDGKFGQTVLDSFRKRGIEALALWPGGRKLFTSNKPLSDVAAFAGQRLRIMDSKILVEQIKALGAIPTVVPFGEVYNALQTGVIDGQENPADATRAMKFFEVQKHVLVTDHGAIVELILANPGWLSRLPENYRTVVKSTFAEVGLQVEDARLEDSRKALEIFKQRGMNIRVADEAERAKLRAVVYPAARNAYISAAGAGANEIIELYETELAKLSK